VIGLAVNINFFSAPQLNNVSTSSKRQDNFYEPARADKNDFRDHLAQASNSKKPRTKFDIRDKRLDNLKQVENLDDRNPRSQNLSRNVNSYRQDKITSESDIKPESVEMLKDEDIKKMSDEELEMLKNLLTILQTSGLPTLTNAVNTDNIILDNEGTNKKLMEILTEVQQKIDGLPIVIDESLKHAIDSVKQLLDTSVSADVIDGSINNNQSTLELEQAKIGLVQKLENIVNGLKNNASSNQLNVSSAEETAVANEVIIQKETKPLFQDQRYKVKVDELAGNKDLSIDIKGVEQNSDNETSNNESDGDSIIDSNKVSDSKNAVPQNDQADENFIIKLDSLQKDINIKDVDGAAKIDKTVQVPKEEVLKQVVRKAEVILKDGKSEMSMKLEPEHLGKLSLKIAIEKGVITAKFVAENQGVKQTIESNFNQLKDMLQEKGITVQSFSVSVGSEGREFNSKNNLNVWKESIKDNKKRTFGEGYIDADGYEPITKINPYNYHEGKIDFKA
jgi:flagellar hook-length control protein FliK